MKPEEFYHYVDAQLKEGTPNGALRNNLLAGGWTKEEIEKAFELHDKRIHNDLTAPGSRAYIIRDIIFWVLFLLVMIMAFLFFLGDPGLVPPQV